MPNYRYKARTAENRNVTGRRAAAGRPELHAALRAEGLYLLSAREQQENRRTRALGARSLSEFCRQLGTMAQSGISLSRSLEILCREESLRPAEREIYAALEGSVRRGNALSDAMVQQGKAFPELLVQMIRSAEEAGTLDATAMRMAAHYEKEHRLRSKVKGAMVYPKILLGMLVIVLSVIMGYVIPRFRSMFDALDTLPASTRLLLALSGFVQRRWWLLLLLAAAAVFAVRALMARPQVRRRWDRATLRLPVLGNLRKTVCTARFARTLSSMYASGVPILTALQASRKTAGNAYIDSQFDAAIAKIRGGEPLSAALASVDGFTNKLVSAVQVGEESGRLDHMLDSIADTLDYEADAATTRMVSYLEPAMIVIMAILVGFIMIAIMKPIYASYSTIGQGSYGSYNY